MVASRQNSLAPALIGVIIGSGLTAAGFMLVGNRDTTHGQQVSSVADRPKALIEPVVTPVPTPQAKPDPSSSCIYKGVARSAGWLDEMYNRHGSQILRDRDKFYDVGKALSSDLTTKLPDPIASAYTQTDLHRDFQIGDFCCCGPEWKVLNVINEHELLAFYPPAYGVTLTIHIGGFDTASLVDNQDLRMGAYRLVYVGNYKRGGSTVRNFVIYNPASKRDFADALASGLILKE